MENLESSINVESCNSQLNKLKSGVKNDSNVTLNFSSNVMGDYIDDTFSINY